MPVYEGHNPLCGDRITMMLDRRRRRHRQRCRLQRPRLRHQPGVRVSLLTDEIKGRPVAEVEAMTNQDILDLLGIEISPARLKCALLSLDTLQHALAERDDKEATTEAPEVSA